MGPDLRQRLSFETALAVLAILAILVASAAPAITRILHALIP